MSDILINFLENKTSNQLTNFPVTNHYVDWMMKQQDTDLFFVAAETIFKFSSDQNLRMLVHYALDMVVDDCLLLEQAFFILCREMYKNATLIDDEMMGKLNSLIQEDTNLLYYKGGKRGGSGTIHILLLVVCLWSLASVVSGFAVVQTAIVRLPRQITSSSLLPSDPFPQMDNTHLIHVANSLTTISTEVTKKTLSTELRMTPERLNQVASSLGTIQKKINSGQFDSLVPILLSTVKNTMELLSTSLKALPDDSGVKQTLQPVAASIDHPVMKHAFMTNKFVKYVGTTARLVISLSEGNTMHVLFLLVRQLPFYLTFFTKILETKIKVGQSWKQGLEKVSNLNGNLGTGLFVVENIGFVGVFIRLLLTNEPLPLLGGKTRKRRRRRRIKSRRIL